MHGASYVSWNLARVGIQMGKKKLWPRTSSDETITAYCSERTQHSLLGVHDWISEGGSSVSRLHVRQPPAYQAALEFLIGSAHVACRISKNRASLSCKQQDLCS